MPASALMTVPSELESACALSLVEEPEMLALAAPGGGTVEDQSEYACLSRMEQERVQRWWGLMQECQEAGHGRGGDVKRDIARREGVSFQTVQLKFGRWQKEGWRALVNRSVNRQPVVPVATMLYLTTLVTEHKRQLVVAEARRKLLLQWRAWLADGGHAHSTFAIPGYRTAPRPLRAGGHPAGWDNNTFSKWVKRWREDEARRIGPKAFSGSMPSLLTSREGCEVGQFIFFDDEVLDFHVIFPGNKTAVRPLAFHALDFVTGCNINRGFKPVIQDGNSRRTVASQLTKSDFDWFAIGTLTQHGWNERTGTTLICEMGTANPSDGLVERIHNTFGKKVIFEHSGRFGAPLKGQIFDAAMTGNFRYKACLESWFNLWRNYLSALPGQTGKNRDNLPEETYGMLRDSARYLKLLERELSRERQQLLMQESYCLFFSQAVAIMNEIAELVNRRTDHDLGQWEKMGFMRPAALDHMPEELVRTFSPETLRSILRDNPEMRRLSPREVWDTHSPRMKKLSPMQVCTLLPLEAAREVRVTTEREFVIEDREIDTDPLHYLAGHCITPSGHHLALNRGETYLVYLNPYAPHEIHVCDASRARRGAFLGTCVQNRRISRADKEAIHHQFGKIRAAVQPVLDDVALQGRPESNRRLELRNKVKRIADTTRPLTPGEMEAQGREESARGLFTEAYEGETETPADAGAGDIFGTYAD